ncbi:MAG: hypothetical protein ACR2J8_05350, partial [Thermomicrobiales bacterium]
MTQADGIRLIGDFTSTLATSRAARGMAFGLHQNGRAVDLVQSAPRGNRTDAATIAAARALSRPVESQVAVYFDGLGLDWPDPSRHVMQIRQADVDRSPASWTSGWQLAQRAIVPAQSSFDAMVRSGIEEARLRICPFGVHPEAWVNP